ncbi:MAG TPA: BatA domain-containing protein [Bacteroidia bacterium]|nr:BatA domain-containing protein [Bacteroidia bacterium]
MNFLFPSFLYALSAISIPIIIHLFNFRRYKKLYFSNVRFLKEVVQESHSKSKLRQLLVLICRCLIIAFLVLAFAQPFIPVKQGVTTSGAKAVSIFIDNSFSMMSVNQNGTLLEDAKSKAEQIAKSLNPADKVQLVAQDFSAVQERWLNKDEFIDQLKGLKVSPASRMLGEIMSRQEDNLNHSGCPVKEAFVISDFQKSVDGMVTYKSETAISEAFVPVTAETKNNVAVDTCWFNTPVHLPGKAEQLYVKLTNYSSAQVTDKPIKLFVNGVEKATSSFTIAPNASTTLTLSYTPDKTVLQQGELKIADYPISFDDDIYFSYKLSTGIPVLCIHPDSMKMNTSLSYLYGKDSLFTLTDASANHLDYSTFPLYRLIVLDEVSSITSGMSHELTHYLSKGGDLFIIPPTSGMDKDSYNNFLTSINFSQIGNIDTTRLKVDKLNYESPIYAGVFEKKEHANMDLPVVFKHYHILHNSKVAYENLMKLDNGDDMLDMFQYNGSHIYLLTVSLADAYSNFRKHAIFVPTLFNIGLYSSPQQTLYYTLGKEQPIEAPDLSMPEGKMFKIKALSDTFSFLPEKRVVNDKTLLFLHNQVSASGNFKLTAGDSIISGYSFNYDRKESEMSFLAPGALDSLCKNAGVQNFSILPASGDTLPALLTEVNRGKFYWKYCILLALLFLAIEESLLRLWKE